MKSALGISILGALGGGIALYVYRTYYKKNVQMPDEEKWHYIGTLKEIVLYPVKSCGALELDSAECDIFGLMHEEIRDRCLVLLDDSDKIAFAGAYPKMLSINSEITSEGELCLKAPNLELLKLNINQLIELKGNTIIDKPQVGYCFQLIECNTEHHIWFSKAVLNREKGLRLFISMYPKMEKKMWRKGKDDFKPFMVLHDRSIRNLNSRLESRNHAHHQQFRGNLLLESDDSIGDFDEDRWEWLRIGENVQTAVILHFNSPCVRCILPNINVKTCERNADFEPLRTFQKFRLRSHKKDPEMGVYFDLHRGGSIKRGDQVFVQYKE